MEFEMQATVEILGKEVQVEWSAAADHAMAMLTSPLLVEMELYFSCLIRKMVRFNRNQSLRYAVSVTPFLKIGFRPVMTKICSVSAVENEPPLEDFLITKPEAFVPKKLHIDFKRGQWVGEFFMS
jgi:hypothetical protein